MRHSVDNPAKLSRLNVASASESFLNDCATGRGLSTNSVRAYRGDLCDFKRFVGASTEIANIDRDVMRQYVRSLMEQRRLKATTVRRHTAVLKVWFRWLEREELVAISPMHRLDLAIRLPKRLPRTLRETELRLLLRTGERQARKAPRDQRHAAIMLYFTVVVLFTTGMRVGELVTTEITDVDPTDGSINVRGKGNRERRVFIAGKQALKVLNRFLDSRKPIRNGGGELLIDWSGRPLTAQDVRGRLRELAREAGIGRNVTPHMLRHTAATQLLRAGVDIRFVQQLLGHASIATTQIYTHVSNESLRERVNLANTLARMS